MSDHDEISLEFPDAPDDGLQKIEAILDDDTGEHQPITLNSEESPSSLEDTDQHLPLALDEPLTDPGDTGEHAPTAAAEPAINLDDTGQYQPLAAYVRQPPTPMQNPILTPNVMPHGVFDEPGGIMRWLPALMVMFLGGCLCISIVALAGFAGVRDEFNEIGTQDVGTRQADVATQYAHANQDFAAGNYDLAARRYQYIETRVPGYLDSGQKLSELEVILAYTATPSPTVSPTATASVTPDPEVSQPAPSPTGPNPDVLFTEAQTAMNLYMYEDAILLFDALRTVAPSYRSEEVKQLLIKALEAQGGIYLRGMNTDGEDRLARGVLLIRRAEELGYSGQMQGDANFAELYLAARAYIDGGALAEALPILNNLCQINCGWAYQGVSVRDMLLLAGGSPG